jgi:putative transposase
MPRANRYIQPGHVYHITHRCHNRAFFLRYGLDRTEYCSRLRDAVRKHRISLFDFCVTCNHIHLLCVCDRIDDLSRFMQQLQGEFAAYYNTRKGLSGAFWGERFHSTMVDCGDHLWNCLRYIDLNMVRAGAVSHPSQWAWCGYRELTGERERYRLLQVDRLVRLLDLPDRQSFARIHKQRIEEAIRAGRLKRESVWTESIAVGSREFVESIASGIRWRKNLKTAITEDGAVYLREDHAKYE